MISLIPAATYMHAKEGCYLCLVAGPLLDTGMQIEGEGVLAICVGCAADMARTAGFSDPDAEVEIEQLAQLVERLNSEITMGKRRETGLRTKVKDITLERDQAHETIADLVEQGGVSIEEIRESLAEPGTLVE